MIRANTPIAIPVDVGLMSQYTSLTVDSSYPGSSMVKSDTSHEVKKLSLASTPPGQEIHVQRKEKSGSISVWVALLLNIVILGILTTAVFVPLKLTTSGSLSSRTKTIYVTGLAVLATACAAFSTAQLRHAWLRKIDVQLATPGVDLSAVNTSWRTALGVSSILESLQKWHIALTLAISGLITTAIVAGLSSTLAQRQSDYTYYLADSQDYSCTVTTEISATDYYTWQLANGSYYSAHPDLDFCPGSVAMTLLGAINTFDPENYGYVDDGVAVDRSALGAPASIYASGSVSTNGFEASISNYGQSLRSTSQCVPVMTKNPITCSSAGTAAYIGQYLTVASPDGKCGNSLLVGSNLTWTDSLTVGQICPTGSLGQATIVIGGIMAGCIYLAEALGDSTWLDTIGATSPGNNSLVETYAVTCEVDMAAALEYRNVQLTLQQTNQSASAYSRSLTASTNEPCTPTSYSSSDDPQNLDKLLALAATAAYQPISIPWVQWARPLTLHQAPSTTQHTDYIRQAPYAFANSKNALEDVLALTSALVLSRVPSTGSSGLDAYIGQKIVQYTRAGTGETWALVYILPSLFVVIVMIALLFSTRKESYDLSSEQLPDLVGLRFEE